MWLWTLATPAGSSADSGDDESSNEDDSDAEGPGFSLEYDAARKIAQGLGAHLEALGHVVVVRGQTARLLSVAERAEYLLGGAQAPAPVARSQKKKQMSLFTETNAAAEQHGWNDVGAPSAGSTNLDRVHQAMLLFASGKSDALRTFLVHDGTGHGPLFWKLAQSLSALYPGGSDEKRWVDGVLARKKGMGLG
jgi:hypothetical protein